jgi:hypothetical protein
MCLDDAGIRGVRRRRLSRRPRRTTALLCACGNKMRHARERADNGFYSRATSYLRDEGRPGVNATIRRPGISMHARARERRRTGGENGVWPGGEYRRDMWQAWGAAHGPTVAGPPRRARTTVYGVRGRALERGHDVATRHASAQFGLARVDRVFSPKI